ncbi:MAG TPA: GFA family protein [Xanthobacteraceae bacterium]|nr:GFA family protein [Xanthobacteraceae bacterium]
MTQYFGGCQCGRVRYSVELDIGELITCNCSRCGRLGLLLAFAPAEKFTLLSGADALTDYQFNKKIVHHLFCATCGVESFARGKRPSDGADMVAINVRCLDGVDPESFPVKKVDGRNF